MTLTPAQQSALFTVALILTAVGALGSAVATTYGLPPIAGLVIVVIGIIGSAIIKGYGLGIQTALIKENASLRASLQPKSPSNVAPDTTKQ